MEESLRLVDSLSHMFTCCTCWKPQFFFGVNQPESYYGKWLGNRYNNPVSMCSSESGIILNSFQSVFEYFADASFVCHGLCLLLRYASAIWSFLPFCTKQCKKWRPTLAACWGLSAQSCSTASWATVWRLKSSCLLSCWRYIQCGKSSMSGCGVCFLHLTDDLGQAEVLYLQCAKSSHLPYCFFFGGHQETTTYDVSCCLKNCFLCFHTSKLPRVDKSCLIGYCSRRASWISSYNQYDINIIESHWLQSHTIHGTAIKLPTFTTNKNNHL